ncbi:MAG: hypothetical protein QOJ28_1705, partial [Mycobacterium sp.]|nr:hypothetical protein [Mycobacterium sp.]
RFAVLVTITTGYQTELSDQCCHGLFHDPLRWAFCGPRKAPHPLTRVVIGIIVCTVLFKKLYTQGGRPWRQFPRSATERSF